MPTDTLVTLLVAKTNAWYAVLASKTRAEHARRMAAYKSADAALQAARG